MHGEGDQEVHLDKQNGDMRRMSLEPVQEMRDADDFEEAAMLRMH